MASLLPTYNPHASGITAYGEILMIEKKPTQPRAYIATDQHAAA